MDPFSCLICKHKKECSERFDKLESELDFEKLEELMETDIKLKCNNNFNADEECPYFEA